MADDLSPWEGVSFPQEQPRREKPPVKRRDPIEERTLNNAEVLAGTRGNKEDHAVRFRDLEKLRTSLKEVITRTNAQYGGGLTKKIQSQFAAIDAESRYLVEQMGGIDQVWGIEHDLNGHITGAGLIHQIRNGEPVADFIIRDASLRVVNTSGEGDYTPFAVYPTGRTVNGVYIPPGVHAQDLWVNQANIANASIDTAHIKDLAVDTGKIKNLAVDTLQIAGEAVTVPATAIGSRVEGDDTWQLAASAMIYMDTLDYIYVWWSLEQGYAGPSQWAFRIKINSTLMHERPYMDAMNDYPSGNHMFLNGAAGWRTVRFEWKGLDADISAQCYLNVMARKK
ncbi:hypothetical protein [Sulfitobacter sp. R18_1]|uniref:hypothetical protein n=1 Tax=Sulfitobacter sp. R18_1 TaxID=2821104 RepID=UPI001ADA0372|nr:hypothetical protein [Sulfitobacter sp. R18_1]MBO9430624.1 hypothetical protein [Sulfitobacter sp. R18_1]